MLKFSLLVTGPIVKKSNASKVLGLVRFIVTVTLKCNSPEKCIKIDVRTTVHKYILSHCLIH